MTKRKRGGILIYMLGVITLLSIIVTEFLMDAAVSMRYRSQMAGRQDLEIIAYSALETSLAVLAEIKLVDEGLYAPIQGWGDPLKYAKLSMPSGYTVKVTISDETGKLSIYDEKLDDFNNLLLELGISYEKVVSLKNELKKYLEKFKDQESSSLNKKETKKTEKDIPGQGLKDDKKEAKEEDKKAVQTLFSLNQLKEIPIFEKNFFDAKGNPKEIFQILKDNVSVYNTGKVNINSAPGLVKKMFLGTLGLGPAAEGKKFFKSMADIGRESNDKRFEFNAIFFDIEIEVTRGPVKYHLSAMVEDKSPKVPQTPSKSSNRNAPTPNTPTNPNPPSRPLPGSNTPGTNANNSTAPNMPGTNGSKNKSNFVFLSLTEDDSSVS